MRNLLTFLFLLIGWNAEAQLDPTSAVLLRSNAKAPDKEQLDRSRYTIRQESGEAKRPASSASSVKKVLPATKVQISGDAVVSSSEPGRTGETTPVAVDSKVEAENESLKQESPAQPPPPAQEPPLVEQVKTMVLGGSETEIESYRESLHPEDIRQNLLELEIAPVYLYSDSSSNYWFRSYQLSSPGFLVAGQVWVTPFFGIRSSFINSFDASLSKGSATQDRLSVDQHWFDAGFRWRTFLGTSRRASHMSWGVDFSEFQLQVPKTATEHVGLKTVGAKFSAEGHFSTSAFHAWNLGVSITPRAEHREVATSLNLRSGARETTTVMGLWLGGTLSLNREDQLFWKASHTVERNRFENAANTPDPVTGQTPTGVSVTTGTSMLTLGVRWGH